MGYFFNMIIIKKNLEGLKFGILKVISRADDKISGGQLKVMYNCECECGNKTLSEAGNLSTGHSKSCGCSWKKSTHDSANWQGFGEISGSFFCQIKTGASTRKLQFEVDIEYLWELFLNQNRRCAISGLPIIFSKLSRREIKKENTASLDRVDSKLGYIKSNIQWVHKDINLMKNKFQQKYFIMLCKKITNFN